MRLIGGSRESEREMIGDQYRREDWMVSGKSEQGREPSRTAGVHTYVYTFDELGW
jgi:hypothetical protein